jgi:UDP-2,3-diacylglucosamine pyrophosphatase LpxH
MTYDTVFISDVHLREHNRCNTQKDFYSFIKELKDKKVSISW